MTRLAYGALAVAVGLVVSAVDSPPASAQARPATPMSLASGRLVFGGDVSVTAGAPDPGWFTYTDYETSAIRRVRAGIAVRARLTRAWSAVFEARGDTGVGVVPYAWYVRYRPWTAGWLTIQAGRIPPVFGAYARRSYPQDNPLIGDPLLYQYLTSLRPDAVPTSAHDLLAMRGRGWLTWYPTGNRDWRPGVPVIAASRWATGIEAAVARGHVQGSLSVTSGSLSAPRRGTGGRTPHVAGRVAWAPVPDLVMGVSGSTSQFLEPALVASLPGDHAGHAYRQRAFGVDGEFARGYWLIRGEFACASWRLPQVGVPGITSPVGARGGYLETRYRLGPRVYVAIRGDHLGFTELRHPEGVDTWDARLSRVEIGGGLTLSRGVVAKGSVLYHSRDAGRVPGGVLWAAQLLWWF